MILLESSRITDSLQYSALLKDYYSSSQISKKNKILFIIFINKLFFHQAFTLYIILYSII